LRKIRVSDSAPDPEQALGPELAPEGPRSSDHLRKIKDPETAPAQELAPAPELAPASELALAPGIAPDTELAPDPELAPIPDLTII
jgi:hypothetical protein